MMICPNRKYMAMFIVAGYLIIDEESVLREGYEKEIKTNKLKI